MRLNFILIVVIVAALIASGYFGINYYKKSATVKELEEKTANSYKEIQELTVSGETLVKEIDDIKINQTTIENAIVAENINISLMENPNEVVRNIMELGITNGTSVIPLSNSGWVDLRTQQGDFRILKITLTVEGSENRIMDFIGGLQDLYPTLVIESLKITTQTTDSGMTNETGTYDRVHSNIGINIYMR